MSNLDLKMSYVGKNSDERLKMDQNTLADLGLYTVT
jgi:hypothetical protein